MRSAMTVAALDRERERGLERRCRGCSRVPLRRCAYRARCYDSRATSLTECFLHKQHLSHKHSKAKQGSCLCVQRAYGRQSRTPRNMAEGRTRVLQTCPLVAGLSCASACALMCAVLLSNAMPVRYSTQAVVVQSRSSYCTQKLFRTQQVP